MRVHFIGVSGTGMGALAALFREAGHDRHRIGHGVRPAHRPGARGDGRRHHDRLRPRAPHARAGSGRRRQRHPANEPRGDGGRTARAAEDEHVRGAPGALPREAKAAGRRRHAREDHDVGDVRVDPRPAPSRSRAGSSVACQRICQPAQPSGARPGASRGARAPFVVEGDEYDAVYWHKQPKFLDYAGVGDDDVAIVTSVEHDHIDIYPDAPSYEAAFAALFEKMPAGGLVVATRADARARALVAAHLRARSSLYALDGDDTGDVLPSGSPPRPRRRHGRAALRSLRGRRLLRALRAQGPRRAQRPERRGAPSPRAPRASASPCRVARAALASFEGVRRRQDLIGEPGGVRLYDDFAHHPTAVDETLRALRARHPQGALWAVFEPRSATAVRSLHQERVRRRLRRRRPRPPRAARPRQRPRGRAPRSRPPRHGARPEGAGHPSESTTSWSRSSQRRARGIRSRSCPTGRSAGSMRPCSRGSRENVHADVTCSC